MIRSVVAMKFSWGHIGFKRCFFWSLLWDHLRARCLYTLRQCKVKWRFQDVCLTIQLFIKDVACALYFFFLFFFINSKTSHVFLDYFSLFGFIRQFLSQFLLLFYVARKTTCLLHCVLYILVSICINLYWIDTLINYLPCFIFSFCTILVCSWNVQNLFRFKLLSYTSC